jgi:uncharacterized membrane protein YkvA (DUF1232 family)
MNLTANHMKSINAGIESGWFRIQLTKWKRDVEFILWQARTLSAALRHPRVPWRAKIAAGVGVGYIFSPIQLIPTFIPVIGQLDDLCVLFVAMKALRKWTPPEVMSECEARAGNQVRVERRRQVGDAEGAALPRGFDRRYPAASS